MVYLPNFWAQYREPKTTAMPTTRPDCQHCAIRSNGLRQCMAQSDARRNALDVSIPLDEVLRETQAPPPTGSEPHKGVLLCAQPDGCDRRLPGTRKQWLARGR